MEYHEIGEKFEYDGVVLEVVKSATSQRKDSCDLCYLHTKFRNTPSVCDLPCEEWNRKDSKEVYYKLVEKCKTKDMEQKETKKIDGMSDGDWSDCEEPTPPAFMVKNEDGSYSVKEQSNEEIYRSLLDKLFATYKSKDKDYGSAFSEVFDELGIDYAYGKLREKMNRIKVLRNKPNMVENEGLEDALLDTAGYAILTLVELKKRKQ